MDERKLIYADDAIEAIEEITWYHQNINNEMVRGANSSEDQAWYKAEDVYGALEQLPSAQPEHLVKESGNLVKGLVNDCISRQAAIDALQKALGEYEDELKKRCIESDHVDFEEWMLRKTFVDRMNGIDRQTIFNLPSAQPEPLTDKEQRIFLAAMGREEKVCKQVDDEYRDCMEPYEDSLVRTCHEITRKVKGALWT